jgi:two-component system sensor kinase FixL
MASSIQDALARETHFAEALSDTTRGIVLVLDSEGRITHANPFLAQFAGYAAPDELIGIDWFERFVHAPDREPMRELFHRVVAGEPMHRYRSRLLDRDQQEHELEWSARPLLADDGHPLGLLAVGIDVSEAKPVQTLLERQQARFASVLAGTQDAFIFIDHRARILAFNAAAERIFGWSAAEVVGQKVNVLMPDPYRTEHDDYIAHYERTGEARAIGRIRVVQGQRRSGEVFPIELSVTKVGVEDDARYAAFIRAKNVPLPQLTPIVERVQSEVRRLASLLGEFRSMSRRQPFELSRVEPGALLRELVEGHRAVCESRGVRLEIGWEPELPVIQIDREKLTQVLLNLVKNAVEAMGEAGGTLALHAREDGAYVVIEVADSGPGIPEGIDVFEPFLTTKREGTGLGLPVARQIVAGHGGELTYQSALGRGTTFSVRLPIDPPSVSSTALRREPH